MQCTCRLQSTSTLQNSDEIMHVHELRCAATSALYTKVQYTEYTTVNLYIVYITIRIYISLSVEISRRTGEQMGRRGL